MSPFSHFADVGWRCSFSSGRGGAWVLASFLLCFHPFISSSMASRRGVSGVGHVGALAGGRGRTGKRGFSHVMSSTTVLLRQGTSCIVGVGRITSCLNVSVSTIHGQYRQKRLPFREDTDQLCFDQVRVSSAVLSHRLLAGFTWGESTCSMC